MKDFTKSKEAKQFIKEARSEGIILEKIADSLNSSGYTTSGGSKITNKNVSKWCTEHGLRSYKFATKRIKARRAKVIETKPIDSDIITTILDCKIDAQTKIKLLTTLGVMK